MFYSISYEQRYFGGCFSKLRVLRYFGVRGSTDKTKLACIMLSTFEMKVWRCLFLKMQYRQGFSFLGGSFLVHGGA
jgi:hypothetical protein